jgi:predicted dehydrogenase
MKLPSTIFWKGDSETIKIGIIGAGNITESIHLPILSEYPGTEISYIADVDMDRAERLSKMGGCVPIQIEERIDTLPECDVVLLAIPVGVRREYIEEFSKRKTPIFSEKPFAKNTEDHLDFIRLNKEMTCNYMRTWFSSTKQMGDIVESEIFGQLESVEIKEGLVNNVGMGKEHYRNNYRLAGGGVLMESGCHTISQIAHILREYDIVVETSKIIWKNGLDISVETNMRATKDSIVEVKYDIGRVEFAEASAKFQFQNARVEFDHTGSSSKLKIYKEGVEDAVVIENWNSATSFGEGVFLKWAEFIESIQSKDSMDINRMTGLEVTKIITSIYEKSESENI